MKHLLLSFFLFMNAEFIADEINPASFVVIYDKEIKEICGKCGVKATAVVTSDLEHQQFMCDECLWEWMRSIGIK